METNNTAAIAGIDEEPLSVYDTIYAAYYAIVAELKEMLRTYPAEYRTYIEVDEVEESRGNQTHDDYFLTPLVTLNAYEAHGQFYLAYTMTIGKSYLSHKQWLDIIRCIIKHTAKENTATDIEEWVLEQRLHFNPYNYRLERFANGETIYQPHYIEPLNDTIDPPLYPESDLPY